MQGASDGVLLEGGRTSTRLGAGAPAALHRAMPLQALLLEGLGRGRDARPLGSGYMVRLLCCAGQAAGGARSWKPARTCWDRQEGRALRDFD